MIIDATCVLQKLTATHGSVQVNAPEEIRVTVDGEALIDDGVAAVLFIVFQVSHPPFSIFSYHVPTLSRSCQQAAPLIDTAIALHFSCLSPRLQNVVRASPYSGPD